MPRTQEARTWLDFQQTVADRVGSKAAVVALTGTGTELWRITPGEPVPVDIQRHLWSVGRFYAAGGSVEVDTHWRAEQWPKSEEVQALEEALGLKVHAAYHRRLGPNPFPAPLLEFG